MFVSALFCVLALAFIILTQSPHLNRPPFDAHNFRQSQTWSTVELYNETGIDLLNPRTNYIGEPGIFVLEFPLYQALAAMLMKGFGHTIAVARVFNLLVTLASAGIVFLMGRRIMGMPSGLLAALLYLSAPLNLTYMSSVLIDPLANLAALGAFYMAAQLLAEIPPKTVWISLCFCFFAIVTALIKALYLFPVICLISLAIGTGGREQRKSALLLLVWLVPSGISFLLWSHHASQVNNASFFTEGVNPLGLLGWDKLFTVGWIVAMAKRFVSACAGPLAALLILSGLLYAAYEAFRTHQRGNFLVVLFFTCGVVIGYWLVFPNINYPHEYYSLITTPFLALAAAAVITRLTVKCQTVFARAPLAILLFIGMGLVTSGTNVLFFLKRNATLPISSNPNLLTLQSLAGNAFQHGDYAMVFVQTERSPGGGNMGSSPAAMTALGVLGTSTIVDDAANALERWRAFRPHYHHLHYVVFFGMPPVQQIVQEFSVPVFTNETEKIYGFAVPNFESSKSEIVKQPDI